MSITTVTSPREARTVVAEILHEQCAQAVEVAQLLVSELVTNAMMHASATDVIVEVSIGPDRATLAVFDESTKLPVVQPLASDSIGGRGMLLIERLAHAWGVGSADEGKKVWVELPCDGHGTD